MVGSLTAVPDAGSGTSFAGQTAIATPNAQTTSSPPPTPAFAPPAVPPPQPVAIPSEAFVEIISRGAKDDTTNADRVVIRLDPPELGQVLIDYRFDDKGVRQVLVAAETAEALRQLRDMQETLLQALERQGLKGAQLSFSQSDPQSRHGTDHFNAEDKARSRKEQNEANVTALAGATLTSRHDIIRVQTGLAAGTQTRLDIHL
jgi:flagellar hook-length control protein FliK